MFFSRFRRRSPNAPVIQKIFKGGSLLDDLIGKLGDLYQQAMGKWLAAGNSP